MSSGDKIYDVIIVGAGPAGLSAAKILATSNKKVLVLEKNKIVGEKVCAGGLTLKDFKEANLPKFIAEREFKSINLYIGSRSIKLESERPWIWTCNRKKLGEWQQEEAKRVGAEILLNSRVTTIRKDSILVNDKREFFFKYLIGADGSNSLVRRFLDLPIKKIEVAIQYVVPERRFNQLEIFIDLEKFGPGYAWIFPHQDYTSIGADADPRFINAEKLKQNLNNWCKELGLNPEKYEFQAAPINYDYRGVKFDNIFLVGDAAGLASGFTGEGIHPAMISGTEVARKIVNPEYDFEELKKIVKTKKLEERIVTLYKVNKTATKLIFEFMAFLLKSAKVRKKLIKFLTEK